MAKRIRPTFDFVLIRKMKRGMLGRIHMTERSAEGVRWFIQEVGPDVVSYLKPGMEVMIMGRPDDKYYPVPGEPDLIMAPQRLIGYCIEDVP